MKENAVAQLIFRARESLRLEPGSAQVDPERLPEERRRYLPLLAAHLDGQLKGARQQETPAPESCERRQDALARVCKKRRSATGRLPARLPGDRRGARGGGAPARRRSLLGSPRGRLLVGRTKRSIAAVAAVIALSGGAPPSALRSLVTEIPHRPPRRRRLRPKSW